MSHRFAAAFQHQAACYVNNYKGVETGVNFVLSFECSNIIISGLYYNPHLRKLHSLDGDTRTVHVNALPFTMSKVKCFFDGQQYRYHYPTSLSPTSIHCALTFPYSI
jgi:hypothetical protein